MKMNLRISNTNDKITWELWARGVYISKIQEYKLVKNAIKAARRIASKLNVEITSYSYCEPETGYEQSLVV